jgi:hypothetical protein
VEGLAGRYDALVRGAVRVLSYPPLSAALPSVYKDLEDRARSRVEALAGDALTIGRFARLWLGNFLSNVGSAPGCAPVSSLFGASGGGTAVVTGAGPSLDAVLPSLRERRGGFFLVATDASVRPLAARGVLPDLIVSVDPQPLVRLHVEGIGRDAISKVPAVLSLLSCPQLFRSFDRRYLFFTLHPTSRLFDTDFLGAAGALLNYRSVGTYALKVALEMGFETLLLAGFDFSYPGLRVYARESFFHGVCLARGDRFRPPHTVEAASMAGRSSSQTPSSGTANPGRVVLQRVPGEGPAGAAAQDAARGSEREAARALSRGPVRRSRQASVLTCRVLLEYAEELAGVVGEARARRVRVLRLGTSGIRVEGTEAVEDARVAALLREAVVKPVRVAPSSPGTRALEPDPARWGDVRKDLLLTLALRSRIFQGARSGEEASENAKSFLERRVGTARGFRAAWARETGALKFAPSATDT